MNTIIDEIMEKIIKNYTKSLGEPAGSKKDISEFIQEIRKKNTIFGEEMMKKH